MNNAKYLKVKAGVRYWEDADVNGVEDIKGDLIPFRVSDYWCPIIDIENGTILDWPEGTEAFIHYKVCYDGEYWLLDDNKEEVAKWKGYYVPNKFLCHGDDGWGDYIIFKVNQDGVILDYKRPQINSVDWASLT